MPDRPDRYMGGITTFSTGNHKSVIPIRPGCCNSIRRIRSPLNPGSYPGIRIADRGHCSIHTCQNYFAASAESLPLERTIYASLRPIGHPYFYGIGINVSSFFHAYCPAIILSFIFIGYRGKGQDTPCVEGLTVSYFHPFVHIALITVILHFQSQACPLTHRSIRLPQTQLFATDRIPIIHRVHIVHSRDTYHHDRIRSFTMPDIFHLYTDTRNPLTNRKSIFTAMDTPGRIPGICIVAASPFRLQCQRFACDPV